MNCSLCASLSHHKMRWQYKKSHMKKDVEKESGNEEEEQVSDILTSIGCGRFPMPRSSQTFISRSQGVQLRTDSVHSSVSSPPTPVPTGTSQTGAQVAARSGGKKEEEESSDEAAALASGAHSGDKEDGSDGEDNSSSDSSDEEVSEEEGKREVLKRF